MNHLSFSTIGFLFILSSCSSAVQEQRAQPRTGEAVAEPKNLSSATLPTFSKSLKQGDFTVDIKSTARQSLTLVARRGGQQLASIDDSLTGETTEAVLADLNQNELPELFVFVRGTGSNPRGRVYGYEFAAQNWERFELPSLSPEAAAGYLGHDQFRIDEDYLFRTFPVFLYNDSPTLSTGGQRTIRYVLDHTLRLTEFNIIDHP